MPNLHRALEALTRLPQTPSQAVNDLTASVRAVAADALKTLSQQQADLDALRAENRALWAELVGLRTYLKRSIAADIGGDTEAWEIIDGLSNEDTTMIDRWLEAMQSKKENP
jgi:hypothetical protein